MPRRRLHAPPPAPGPLAEDFARIREQFGVVPAFPDDVEAAAREAAQRAPSPAGRDDLRELPFFTVDPPGSMDLDQAMHLERLSDGFRVRYAIADVGVFVDHGGPIEAEAWRRGETMYCPDVRAPLYPTVLSEGAASLLPGRDRPAIVFTVELDARGEVRDAGVRRALVRSHRRLDYASLPAADAELLGAIGRLREALERDRGGVRLRSPRQTVVADPSTPAGYRLAWERRLPSEDWNAQISLLAGMAAARVMLDAKVGLLRTMGGIDAFRLAALRRRAAALDVAWPEDVGYAEFVRGLDAGHPHEAVLVEEAHSVMGRAGYTAFDGAPPPDPVHGALAAAYAHCTAPLRRLADRYVLDLLCPLSAGAAPDAALTEPLGRLPAVMERADDRAEQLELAIVDDVEARTLEHRVAFQHSGIRSLEFT